MATQTKQRGRPSNSSKAQTADSIKVVEESKIQEPVQIPVVQGEPVQPVLKATVSNIPNRPIKRFEKYDMVDVINNCNGKLIYVSSVTSYSYEWEEMGDIQSLPVEELLNMRNSQIAFFKNNWIEFSKDVSEDIKRFLHVEKYYENAVRYDEFEDLFEESPEIIAKRISLMSPNAQDNLACLAVQMIEDRKLDSLKIIDAIENGLGYKITENE